MKKFEILEHKADLKIKVLGKNKEELFENAMIGMFEGANYEPTTNDKQLTTKIKISSIDLPSLLIDFLNEVLYFCETKKEIYQKVNFKKFSQNEIEGTLIGKKLKRMGVHIKAATYHNLEIKKNKAGFWQAVILFDI